MTEVTDDLAGEGATPGPAKASHANTQSQSAIAPQKEKEFLEAICKEIAAEHALVNARMTWNMTFQGILFAGFALAVSRLGPEEGSGAEAAQKLHGNNPLLYDFLGVLPVAGIVVAAGAFVGVSAAYLQIKDIKQRWRAHSTVLLQYGPRPFSNTVVSWLGRLPLLAITGVIVWAWWSIIPK